MKITEIFKKPGIYRFRGIQVGTCIEISDDRIMYLLFYSNKNDMYPERVPLKFHESYLYKNYAPVTSIRNLFL